MTLNSRAVRGIGIGTEAPRLGFRFQPCAPILDDLGTRILANAVGNNTDDPVIVVVGGMRIERVGYLAHAEQ